MQTSLCLNSSPTLNCILCSVEDCHRNICCTSGPHPSIQTCRQACREACSHRTSIPSAVRITCSTLPGPICKPPIQAGFQAAATLVLEDRQDLGPCSRHRRVLHGWAALCRQSARSGGVRRHRTSAAAVQIPGQASENCPNKLHFAPWLCCC